LHPSTGLRLSWKAITVFIDPETAEKITFLQSKELGEMKKKINENQLE
jgi:hypothetical protein